MIDFYSLSFQFIFAIFVIFICSIIGLAITLLVRSLLSRFENTSFSQFVKRKSYERKSK